MADKTTFTNPAKPGANQNTTFMQTLHPESSKGDESRIVPQAVEHSVTRGESQFAKLNTAR